MDNDISITTKNAQETQEFGFKIATSLRGKGTGGQASVLCLYGDLGSGKTTFAQGVAKGLGITSRLLSPTFIIVRRYQIPQAESFLYHIDLYRTKTSRDIEHLGFSEILNDPASYILIEWAEKLGKFLPAGRIDMRFVTNKDDTHTIIMKKGKT